MLELDELNTMLSVTTAICPKRYNTSGFTLIVPHTEIQEYRNTGIQIKSSPVAVLLRIKRENHNKTVKNNSTELRAQFSSHSPLSASLYHPHSNSLSHLVSQVAKQEGLLKHMDSELQGLYLTHKEAVDHNNELVHPFFLSVSLFPVFSIFKFKNILHFTYRR